MDSKNVDGFKINMHNENGKYACHISFWCQYCIKMGNCEDVLKCNILQGVRNVTNSNTIEDYKNRKVIIDIPALTEDSLRTQQIGIFRCIRKNACFEIRKYYKLKNK